MESVKLEDPRDRVRLLRAAEVCNLLGISRWTLDDWLRRGDFVKPIYTNDNAPMRFRFRDVEAWLAKRQVKRRNRTPRGQLKQA
jgi:predicted DNA-binding transcriptional regulator AlpA